MKKILVGIISLILFSGIGLLLAANQGYFGYGVSNTLSRATLNSSSTTDSTPISKVEEWGVCKTVTSTDARLLFIPTKTTTERSTFITNKPSHITLGTCGCTTNADCGAGNICSGYVAGAGYCDGEFEYTTDGYCQYIGREGNICNGIIDEVLCNNQTEYTLHTSFREYLPACARVQGGEPGGTAYCGQEYQTQSECNASPYPSCYWTAGTATLGTCIALASCTTPRGTTIAHGSSVTAYLSSSVPCGSTCTPQTRTCNNGVLGGSYTNQSCTVTSCGGGCFKEGTQVALSDGTTENIENIKIGDVLMGSENGNNKVLRLFKLPNDDRKMYSINNSDYFVTDTHPFMTTEGWKSFNPKGTSRENPSLMVSNLNIGDIMITNKGIETIYSIDSIERSGYVYNFMLDNNSTYYADGYLVHNVEAPGSKCIPSECSAGYCCPNGCPILINGSYYQCP